MGGSRHFLTREPVCGFPFRPNPAPQDSLFQLSFMNTAKASPIAVVRAVGMRSNKTTRKVILSRTPVATRESGRAKMERNRRPRSAPRATRIPISRVRRETVNDMIAKVPARPAFVLLYALGERLRGLT